MERTHVQDELIEAWREARSKGLSGPFCDRIAKVRDVPGDLIESIFGAESPYSGGHHQRDHGVRVSLTEREVEVLQLASFGWPSHCIADALGMTDYTAKQHLKSIRSKYQVTTTLFAVACAIRQNVIR